MPRVTPTYAPGVVAAAALFIGSCMPSSTEQILKAQNITMAGSWPLGPQWGEGRSLYRVVRHRGLRGSRGTYTHIGLSVGIWWIDLIPCSFFTIQIFAEWMLNDFEIKDITTTPMKRKWEDGSRESEGYIAEKQWKSSQRSGRGSETPDCVKYA